MDALLLIEALQPDVVLMDIAMPELNGLEVVARVTKGLPQVRVIMLSMHQNEQYVLQALRAQAPLATCSKAPASPSLSWRSPRSHAARST